MFSLIGNEVGLTAILALSIFSGFLFSSISSVSIEEWFAFSKLALRNYKVVL